MPAVVLLGTGGTIASRLDRASGDVVAQARGKDLLGRLPEIADIAEIRVEDFSNLGSYQFSLPFVFDLACCVNARLRDPAVAGVVVTQGTDTMEESAYMVDLLLEGAKPVVFTGAQRDADQPDSDGPRNLMQSLRTAASPSAVGMGALVVFDGTIHAARDVTKMHTSRGGTFQSPDHGKLGDVDGEMVLFHRKPLLRRTFRVDRIEPAVDLIKVVMGADARFLDCALESGAKGIVLEAFGRGNANPEIVAGVARAVAAGVPVLVASRSPSGRVRPIYGNGGGRDLEAAGAVFCGDLRGVKARVLLSVLLADDAARGRLKETICDISP